MSQEFNCPVCGYEGAEEFFEILGMPVFIGVRWPDARSARECAKGELRLAYCRQCGFIWNRAFDPTFVEYSVSYENSLHFSPVFQSYSRALVEHLIATYDLVGKDVIDIGCGKGDFLALLCESGVGRGIGFDPSHEGERVQSTAKKSMTFVRDLYSEKYREYHADLITSRYVLEHIAGPVDFLRMTRSIIGHRRDTIVYFEVPNVRLILERLSVWDIIYEHCSYFGRESLAAAFETGGFDVLDVREAYDGQFIAVEAKPAEDEDSRTRSEWGDLDQLTSAVQIFRRRFQKQVEDWTQRIERLRAENKRLVAWGAGAKAVGFLNMLGLGESVPYVVDINPHKHGFFLGGTGQEIVSPSFLSEYRPDTVILMNPIYREEIATQVMQMGLSVDFLEAS